MYYATSFHSRWKTTEETCQSSTVDVFQLIVIYDDVRIDLSRGNNLRIYVCISSLYVQEEASVGIGHVIGCGCVVCNL